MATDDDAQAERQKLEDIEDEILDRCKRCHGTGTDPVEDDPDGPAQCLDCVADARDEEDWF